MNNWEKVIKRLKILLPDNKITKIMKYNFKASKINLNDFKFILDKKLLRKR